MTEDLMLKARAAELIQRGIHRQKARKICCYYVAVAFIAGLLAGAAMPFQLKAVPIEHQQPGHTQPSAKP